MNDVKKAADIIKAGGLVAFPTETVYGLGADALNSEAVAKIYDAKGRPSKNPLIVHIADIASLDQLAVNIPDLAYQLADRFWPGPLTLILEKSNTVPDIVTSGGPTVAIRMPDHPLALELIRASQTPIVAPSANTSGRPSPTSAQLVLDDLGSKIGLILDGGASVIGLESTVLDLTSDPPVILRSGAITSADLTPFTSVDFYHDQSASAIIKSPGMAYRHYAPKAKLVLFSDPTPLAEYARRELVNKKVGILATNKNIKLYPTLAHIIDLGDSLESVAHNLYSALLKFDQLGVDIILAETYAETGLGIAIMNRLRRAAEG